MKGTYGTKAYCNESISLNYHNTNNVFNKCTCMLMIWTVLKCHLLMNEI